MKISLVTKVIITAVMVIILGVMIYFLNTQSPSEITTEEKIGEIHFRLYNEDDTLVIDDMLNLYHDDTLFTILNRHYDLVCADRNYQPDDTCSYSFINGYVLLGIDDIESDWYTTVLSIYVNGDLAVEGVSGIDPKDGDVITIRKTDYHE